jgi:hypothetical protein
MLRKIFRVDVDSADGEADVLESFLMQQCRKIVQAFGLVGVKDGLIYLLAPSSERTNWSFKLLHLHKGFWIRILYCKLFIRSASGRRDKTLPQRSGPGDF